MACVLVVFDGAKYLWEITLFDPFELACVRGSFWTWKTRSD